MILIQIIFRLNILCRHLADDIKLAIPHRILLYLHPNFQTKIIGTIYTRSLYNTIYIIVESSEPHNLLSTVQKVNKSIVNDLRRHILYN